MRHLRHLRSRTSHLPYFACPVVPDFGHWNKSVPKSSQSHCLQRSTCRGFDQMHCLKTIVEGCQKQKRPLAQLSIELCCCCCVCRGFVPQDEKTREQTTAPGTKSDKDRRVGRRPKYRTARPGNRCVPAPRAHLPKTQEAANRNKKTCHRVCCIKFGMWSPQLGSLVVQVMSLQLA